MKLIIPFAVAGLAISVAMGAIGYAAGTAGRVDVSGTVSGATADRSQIEEIVRDYLVTNPEIMIEVQQALETRQAESQRVAQSEIIEGASAQIFDAAHDGIVGNPEGDVTVVEFFDYNCGYCKRALEDMEAMVSEDPQLRFVLKEFPILGPDSQRAHVVSMAFHTLLPDSYDAFHTDLLATEGRVDEDEAVLAAIEHGADETALRQAMEDPAIIEAFQATYALADRLAITGTPSYVVGQEVVFGAMGREVLSEKVAAIRQENGE